MAETTLQHRDRHEARDVSRRGLLLFGAGFGVLMIVSIALLWVLFGARAGGFSAAQTAPQLANDTELGQRQQLSEYLAQQHASLERLGWTDGSQQYAQVPIEDAMRLLASRGAAP